MHWIVTVDSKVTEWEESNSQTSEKTKEFEDKGVSQMAER